MGQATPDTGVQSVSRAMRLLRLLADRDQGWRVSELASAAGLPVSTTHRLLATLQAQEFAQFDAPTKCWHVGREAYATGAAYTRRRSYVVPAWPFLSQLRDLSRETANLGVLDDNMLVTVAQVESREIMRAISPRGGRVPVLCSAMGKAILGGWTDAQIADFAERNGMVRMTRYSLPDIGAVLDDIAATRARGYAIDEQEHVVGLRCVAAPVWSPQGEIACAISVSGLAARLSVEKIPQVGAQVAQVAAALTTALGGVAPKSRRALAKKTPELFEG